MKTKYNALKTSVIGTIAATLMAVSAHSSAADVSLPIWAGQFKQAYGLAPWPSDVTSGPGHYNVADHLLWAGQFKQAYGLAPWPSDVTSGPGHYNAADHLLWAGQFKQAYQPAREEVVEGSEAIELAMDRK